MDLHIITAVIGFVTKIVFPALFPDRIKLDPPPAPAKEPADFNRLVLCIIIGVPVVLAIVFNLT